MLNENWHTSTRSGDGGNCVQARYIDGQVEVRHSKNPDGAVLSFTRAEWEAFGGGVVDGEFRLPPA